MFPYYFFFNRNRRYDLKQKELEQRRLYGNVRTILKHLNDIIKKQDQDLTILNGATLEILNLLVSISEHDSFNHLNLRGILWIYFLPSSSSVKERRKYSHSYTRNTVNGKKKAILVKQSLTKRPSRARNKRSNLNKYCFQCSNEDKKHNIS